MPSDMPSLEQRQWVAGARISAMRFEYNVFYFVPREKQVLAQKNNLELS